MKKRIFGILSATLLVLGLASCKETVSVPTGDDVSKIIINDQEITKDFDSFELQKLLFESFQLADKSYGAVETYKYQEIDKSIDGVSTKQKTLDHLIYNQYTQDNVSVNYVYYKNDDYYTQSSGLTKLDAYSRNAIYERYIPSVGDPLFYIKYYYQNSKEKNKESGYSKTDMIHSDFNIEPGSIDTNYGVGKQVDLSISLIPSGYYQQNYKLTSKYIIFKFKYTFNFDKYVSNDSFDFLKSKEDGEYQYETYMFDYNLKKCVCVVKESYTIDTDEKYEDFSTCYTKMIGQVVDSEYFQKNVDSFTLHLDEDNYVNDKELD